MNKGGSEAQDNKINVHLSPNIGSLVPSTRRPQSAAPSGRAAVLPTCFRRRPSFSGYASNSNRKFSELGHILTAYSPVFWWYISI
ncbi:hypothetical protein L6452_39699 [Arctium lappa]|uniref:Uncharacterized protein n=1 Tax=Arctium lappa TaxID=4217 RepID=A0ACB8XTR0_ARCLA|nr:hypothetical protein L6452_39699 [Arctium lappa]